MKSSKGQPQKHHSSAEERQQDSDTPPASCPHSHGLTAADSDQQDDAITMGSILRGTLHLLIAAVVLVCVGVAVYPLVNVVILVSAVNINYSRGSYVPSGERTAYIARNVLPIAALPILLEAVLPLVALGGRRIARSHKETTTSLALLFAMSVLGLSVVLTTPDELRMCVVALVLHMVGQGARTVGAVLRLRHVERMGWWGVVGNCVWMLAWVILGANVLRVTGR